MAQAVSREPVIYVRNILKYYTAYKLSEAEDAARSAAQDEHAGKASDEAAHAAGGKEAKEDKDASAEGSDSGKAATD